MTSLSDINGIFPTSRTFKLSPRLVDSSCITGIEIEVENMDTRIEISPEFWNLTNDGSLRNSGIEFVSTPLFGQDLVTAITMADEEISSSRHRPQLTSRCGLHVHLDVSSFTVDQLITFICSVALIEGLLYEYVGIDRRDNIYCLPIANTDNILPYLNNIKYGHNNSSVRDSINKTQKYSGFNIKPILNQGSVEFRQHKGTYSADTIIDWVNILSTVRKAALEVGSTEELMEMNYNSIIDLLFPQWEQCLDIPRAQAIAHVKDGWLVAKDILNFNKLDDVWNEIKDVYTNENRLTSTGSFM